MRWALQALVGLPVGMSSIEEWIEALTERFRAEEYEARAAMQRAVQRRERMRAETRQRTEVGLMMTVLIVSLTMSWLPCTSLSGLHLQPLTRGL